MAPLVMSRLTLATGRGTAWSVAGTTIGVAGQWAVRVLASLGASGATCTTSLGISLLDTFVYDADEIGDFVNYEADDEARVLTRAIIWSHDPRNADEAPEDINQSFAQRELNVRLAWVIDMVRVTVLLGSGVRYEAVLGGTSRDRSPPICTGTASRWQKRWSRQTVGIALIQRFPSM